MQDKKQEATVLSVQNPEVLEIPGLKAAPEIKQHEVLWPWMLGLALAVLTVGGIITYILVNKPAPQTASSTTVIKTQKVNTQSLSPAATNFQVTNNDQVVINGQLQAASTLVVSPTAAPTTPTLGQIYLDQTTKQLYYYNGTSFASLGNQVTNVTNINGNTTPGVTSLQGLNGSLTLLGGSGLTVTSGSGKVTLDLPQNLTAAANPTFAGINLSGLTTNQVVYSSAGGSLQTITPAGAGLCLMSTAGAPAFGACSGGSSLASINGGTGAVTISNSTNPIGLNGNIVIDDASVATSGLVNTGAQSFAGLKTFANGLSVTASGIAVTGNSTISGTLSGLTGLTVASGGANITGNSTISGTLNGLTGLTVASGGANVTGNSTITGIVSGLTGLTSAGTITLSGLNSVGVVQTNGSGVLSTSNLNLATGPVTGILNVTNGGTGVNGATASNGQLLIGNGTGYTLNTLSPGTGISIDNTTAGQITINATTGGTCPACANQALSNLSGVAINQSLLPGSTNTIDLGDTTHFWKTAFVNTITPGGALTVGSALQTFNLQGATGSQIAVNGQTYTFPALGGEICTSAGSANCTTQFGGGGSPTTTLQDAYNNSSSPATITSTSGAKTIVFKAGPTFDSTSFFQIQDSGSSPVLVVDTSNDRVGIGAAAGATALKVTGTSSFGFNNNGSNLTVVNGGNSTVFNVVTSATASANGAFLGNPVNATGGTTLVNSAFLNFQNSYWNGATHVENNIGLENIATDTSGNYRLAVLNNGGAEVASIAGTGATKFENSTNSAAAFQIQNATAADTLFTVDTTARGAGGGNLIKIGNSTGTDAALTILQVDASAGEPTLNLGALNGGLFYDSIAGHLKVIEGGQVKTICNLVDLGCGTGGGVNLQLSNLAPTVAVNLDLNPGGDNAKDLGSAANSWRTLYADTSVLSPRVDTAAASGTLNIGDTNATTVNVGNTGSTTTIKGGQASITVGSGPDNIDINTTSDVSITSAKFNLSSSGGIQLLGGQNPDITTASNGNGISIQPGVSTASGAASGLVLKGAYNTGSGGTCATSCTGGTVTIQGGNASGASGANHVGGDVVIDGGAALNGTSTNTGGTISIGTTNASTINLGNSTASTTLLLTSGTGSISLGNSSNDIAISTASQNFTVSSTHFKLAAGGGVTLFGGNSPDIGTAVANTANGITIQPGASTGAGVTGGGLLFQAGNVTNAACTTCTGGTATLQGGNATGSSGTRNGGGVIIDAGTGASNNGTISIGTTNAKTLAVGNASAIFTLQGASSSQITVNSQVFTFPAAGGEICTSAGSATCNAHYNGSGVTTVGSIDSNGRSADGASILGTSIIMQTADATHPGLLSNVGQTISGAKLFTSAATFEDAANSATAFQIQNNAGSELLTADSLNNRLTVRTDTEAYGQINTPWGGFGNYSSGGNLAYPSEDLNNVSCGGCTNWVTSNITVTGNDGASNPSPAGDTTADKLVSSASGTHTIYDSTGETDTGTYNFSMWIKTNSGTQPFDLRIDTVGGTPVTGTAASFTATTTWTRYNVMQTITGSPSDIRPTIRITNNNATIVAWGADLVLGSSPGVYEVDSNSQFISGFGAAVRGDIALSNSTGSTGVIRYDSTVDGLGKFTFSANGQNGQVAQFHDATNWVFTVGDSGSYSNFYNGLEVNGGLTIGSTPHDTVQETASGDLSFISGSDRTININSPSGANGNNLSILGGAGNGSNKNGGNLILQGGAATGTGAAGLVVVKSSNSNTDAILGSELAGGETCSGTNWAGTGPWTHTTGSTVALTCTTPASVTAGATYQVSFTMANNNQFGVSPALDVKLGNQSSSTTYSLGGTYTVTTVITTANTTGLVFTPGTDFSGNISAISVKLISSTNGTVLAVKNSSNTVTLEVRSSGSTTNSFVGLNAGQNNTSIGVNNSAFGSNALQVNTTGTDNTAFGYSALQVNTASNNTAFGSQALKVNVSGTQNTALGSSVLAATTTGGSNTGIGYHALQANTVGTDNTAIGNNALAGITGQTYYNTAIGSGALSGLGSGGANNDALGAFALSSLNTGSFNVGIGDSVGSQHTNTSNSVYIGKNAGSLVASTFKVDADGFGTTDNQNYQTAIGADSQVQCANCMVLGSTDSSAPNVGIGTTKPQNTLSVSPVMYKTGTISQTASATVVGAGGANFTTAGGASLVGTMIIYADGTSDTITGYTDATHITVGTSRTHASSNYRIQYTGFQVKNDGTVYMQGTSSAQLQVKDNAGDVVINSSTTVSAVKPTDTGNANLTALNVQGDARAENLDLHGDGSIYWNAYWDYGSAASKYANNGSNLGVFELYQAAGPSELRLATDAGGTNGNTFTPTDVLTISNTGAWTIKNSTDSSTAFRIQNAAGTTTVLNADTSTGTLTVAKTIVNGTLTVNGHIISGNTSGSTTVSVGTITGCIDGSNGSVSISGNDTSGTVTINTGGTCSGGGKLVTINFANNYGSAPRIMLTPADSSGSGATIQYYNGASGTTNFTIDTANAPATGTTYKYNYFVVQ